MLKATKLLGHLSWMKNEVPADIATALHALASEYGQLLEDSQLGKHLIFEKVENCASDECVCEVKRDDTSITVRYNTLSTALRGVGMAMGNIPCERTSTPFKHLGIMIDFSRNRVMKPEYVKQYMSRMALMGYNTLYLYCEDTFAMEGEPYFGFMRGAYTMDELHDIDDWGAQLGIEVVGCIELLGHMAQVLRWPAYANILDTPGILLGDSEDTYAFTAKIIDFWSKALRSRRIHIGMDEAHNFGRGRYYDIHGDVSHFELFNRHLARISAQCTQAGLAPMIWSDMYFRIADTEHHDYYAGKPLPQEVINKIPESVGMVYWDYYHTDEETYRRLFNVHKLLNKPVIFAGGIWTWTRLWYDHVKTVKTTLPALAMAREAKVDEVFFTMWGDDGGYCDYESTLAGLQCASDMAYGMNIDNYGESYPTNRRFLALCGGNLSGTIQAGSIEVESILDEQEQQAIRTPLAILLYDDPLLGILDHLYTIDSPKPMEHLLEKLTNLQKKIRHFRCNGGGNFTNYNNALRLLVMKLKLRRELVDAYKRDDREALMNIADIGVRECLKASIAYRRSFSKDWNQTSKPFGVEAMEARIGALTTRFEVLAERIAEYLDGDITSIPELEYNPDLRGQNGNPPGIWQIERAARSGNVVSTC
jgi:hexosaminidase